MRRAIAAVAVAVALVAGGCGGPSQEEVDELEARVAQLETTVAELQDEIATLRQLEAAVGEITGFLGSLRDKLPDLDGLGDLLDDLRSFVP